MAVFSLAPVYATAMPVRKDDEILQHREMTTFFFSRRHIIFISFRDVQKMIYFILLLKSMMTIPLGKRYLPSKTVFQLFHFLLRAFDFCQTEATAFDIFDGRRCHAAIAYHHMR